MPGMAQRYLEENGGSDGVDHRSSKAMNKLGTNLGIRTRQAMIVTGPTGSQSLQDGPRWADRSGDRSRPVAGAPRI